MASLLTSSRSSRNNRLEIRASIVTILSFFLCAGELKISNLKISLIFSGWISFWQNRQEHQQLKQFILKLVTILISEIATASQLWMKNNNLHQHKMTEINVRTKRAMSYPYSLLHERSQFCNASTIFKQGHCTINSRHRKKALCVNVFENLLKCKWMSKTRVTQHSIYDW